MYVRIYIYIHRVAEHFTALKIFNAMLYYRENNVKKNVLDVSIIQFMI